MKWQSDVPHLYNHHLCRITCITCCQRLALITGLEHEYVQTRHVARPSRWSFVTHTHANPVNSTPANHALQHIEGIGYDTKWGSYAKVIWRVIVQDRASEKWLKGHWVTPPPHIEVGGGSGYSDRHSSGSGWRAAKLFQLTQ